MARLPIIDGTQVQMVLKTKYGSILDLDLLSLYLINKYGGDDVFISVHIPERTDEDFVNHPAIDYDIFIKEIKHV
jgi:hypothetical protein